MTMRRLNQPEPAEVLLDADRRPVRVRWRPSGPGATGATGGWNGQARGGGRGRGRPRAAADDGWREADVERLLDTWYVDDAWWTEGPVRRIYHECQLSGGVHRVLVFDLVAKSWLMQR